MAVQQLGGTCIVMENFDPNGPSLDRKTQNLTQPMVPTMFVRMLKPQKKYAQNMICLPDHRHSRRSTVPDTN